MRANSDASSCHTHHVVDYAGNSGTFTAPDHEYPSHLELTATATDADGLRTTKTVRLDPSTVDLTLDSSPAGMRLSLGSECWPRRSRARSSAARGTP